MGIEEWQGVFPVMDAATGKEQRSLAEHASNFTSVAFSADGTRIATASAGNTARLGDVSGNRAHRS